MDNNQNFNNNFGNQVNNQLNNGQNMNNNFSNQANNQFDNNQNMVNNFNNQLSNIPNNNQLSNTSSVNNMVNKPKNNKPLIIGIAVVCVIVLILIMSGGSSGKTLHCKQHIAIMGIVYDTDETYKIGEGKINSAQIKFTYYLDQFRNVEGDLDAWAAERISTDKSEFSKISGCNYKSDYSKNKKLVETITCDNTGYLGMGGTDYSGSTAEQIYDRIKLKKESDSTASYTCE